MSLADSIIGKPLATSEERGEHIGVAAGIPIFGLDALTSAAYGPEAAMTLLIPLGLAGAHFIVPVISAILILLVIVFFSYRQTIAAYPNGGGSYTVASENLGDGAGLLAAAALMIDYILTAAVGISAGVTALTGAVPSLAPHTLAFCLVILAILAIVNMRGVKDTGATFIAPTFLFVGTLLILIGVGVYRTILSGGHPVAVLAPPAALPATVKYLGLWLLMKTFASGCAAMTGVEAVSNGGMAFGEPRAKKAQGVFTIIIGILIVLLFGIAYLSRAYGITAMEPDAFHYQSVLSILTSAVFGRGWFYYLTSASVLMALSLSANTAYADFPRLAKAIAMHDFLPHVFILRGRRLLFSHGIYALTGFTAVILILFGGVTDRLIPLYAIGAFLAFTLSQAGMVMHWKRHGGPGWQWKMTVNGVGATATGLTLLVVLVAKFVAGAWVTALLVPLLILLMSMVKRHYVRVASQTADDTPLDLTRVKPLFVIVPLDGWSKITKKGMDFALALSPDVQAVHVDCGEGGEHDDTLDVIWQRNVVTPVKEAGLPVPQLITLQSPYRFVLLPLVEYVLKMEREHQGRTIAVLVPELVVRHWWENLLHNNRAQLLKLLLLVKGNKGIVVLDIPWYLQE